MEYRYVGGKYMHFMSAKSCLPPAPSYDLWLSDVGTWPSSSHHLVLSLQWVVMPFGGCEAPRAWIFDGVLTVRVPNTRSPWVQLLGARACPEPGYEVGP
jgi:hypothetical protein